MTGDFLFIYYGFGGDTLAPRLTLYREGADALDHFEPRGHTFTMQFTTDTRHCTGWHDLATGESFPCPEAATLPAEYQQCMHCQRKTGFNPAFYNANSVSQQQQARNAQPHFLYLAHFGPGIIKVGISWSGRGIRRLLDQGARSYVIIKEYPNANVARQYEAKVASLPGIAETLQAKTKHTLLSRPYDATNGAAELQAARQRLQDELGIESSPEEPIHLDPYYLGEHSFLPTQLVHLKNDAISGRCLGMIGSTFLAEQSDVPFALALGKLAGYKVHIRADEQPNQHTPQQVSLF